MSTDLQILRDLESAGAISRTSISLPDDTPYPKVEALFAYFGSVSHALRFYVGDLINWGEGRYGDKVYQAADATGLTEGTLQNYASVCGRVAPERRREGLSFAIHQTVAYLEPAEQERWLERADENGWNVKHLRELLRDEGLIAQRPQPAWTPPAPAAQQQLDDEAALSGGDGVGDLAVTGAGQSESEPVRPSPESVVSELLWAAGLFDGEGTFCVNHRHGAVSSFRATLHQAGDVQPVVLDRFCAAVGLGKVFGPYTRPGNRKLAWYWDACTSSGAEAVYEMLEPFISPQKREQGADALRRFKSRTPQIRAAADVPDDLLSFTPAGVETSHPRVLADLRDRYERQIDATGRTLITVRFDLLERERDALNWALERLAPELA